MICPKTTHFLKRQRDRHEKGLAMLSHDSKPMEGQEFAAKNFHLKAPQEIMLPTENENCEDERKSP